MDAVARKRARRVSVLIVDDQEVVRIVMRTELGRLEGVDIVGEASTGGEVVALTRQLSPDVVVVDPDTPVTDGITATVALVALPVGPRVIAFSSDADGFSARALLAAGVFGCVPKEYGHEELAPAIRRVAGGQRYLSPRLGGGGAATADGVTLLERESAKP